MSRLLIGLVFAVIVAGAFLIGRSGQAPDSATPADNSDADPGYAARDAEIIETGTDGRELYRLNAALIHQRPESDRVQLESIRMDYRAESQELWKISAQSGEVLSAGTVIELDGKVRVTGPLPDGDGRISLATERLEFDTQAERVATDAPVLLTWEGQQLRSRGLTANLKDGRVQLKSAVNGRFTP